MRAGEDAKQLSPLVERLAMRRAMDKANIAKWSLKVAILSYAILMTIIILVSQGVGLNIVAILGVFGLVTIWLTGWKQGSQLRERFYAEELSSLEEKPGGEGTALLARLTSREIEILHYVAQGHSNKHIAYELNVGEQTIKNYVSGIFSKLDARGRTEAAIIAIKHGIISIE
ncbi:MAG: response regulator transcription factor [Chloroflexi bacterium]|nr:response regulator transcription factor [Chloroflexota bacterium]